MDKVRKVGKYVCVDTYILCGSSVSNLPLFEFHPAHVICSQSRYVDVLSSWEFMYLYICKQIVWDEIWSSYRSYHRYLWDRGRTTKMAQKPWFYHQLKLLDYPVYITINFYCSESPSLSANANTSMNLPCFPRKFVHFLVIHSPILQYLDFYGLHGGKGRVPIDAQNYVIFR
jgi:hypothetical protein